LLIFFVCVIFIKDKDIIQLFYLKLLLLAPVMLT